MDKISNSTTKINYYVLSTEFNQEELKHCEVGLVGAGLGGWFDHTGELHIVKNEVAINEPGVNYWKKDMDNKHKQMIKLNVKRLAKKFKFQKAQEYYAQYSPWRTNLMGLYMLGWQHMNAVIKVENSRTVVHFTNDVLICVMLILMLVVNLETWVIDVTGAFLNGRLDNSEKYKWKFCEV